MLVERRRAGAVPTEKGVEFPAPTRRTCPLLLSQGSMEKTGMVPREASAVACRSTTVGTTCCEHE